MVQAGGGTVGLRAALEVRQSRATDRLYRNLSIHHSAMRAIAYPLVYNLSEKAKSKRGLRTLSVQTTRRGNINFLLFHVRGVNRGHVG